MLVALDPDLTESRRRFITTDRHTITNPVAPGHTQQDLVARSSNVADEAV
jgi:hypothetical protein